MDDYRMTTISKNAQQSMPCGGCLRDPCRLCWLYFHRKDYKRHWDSAPPLDRKPVKDISCIHRGEVLRLQECESCSGKRKLKIYSCALHGECYLGAKLPDVRRCDLCLDRKSVTIPVEVLTKGAE